MKNTNKKQKGFTLPEVMISIVIIVMVIITATSLLVTSARANQNNLNQVVAYNLAQEALEGFRNIRDGLWMHNQYWRGNENRLFGSEFVDDGFYVIKKNEFLSDSYICSNEIADVRNASPWKLEPYSESASEISLNGNDRFKRWLEIKTIPYDLVTEDNTDKLKFNVTAVVLWTEGSKEKVLRLPTVLTDWKNGPL